MAIVSMKRLGLLALESDREALFDRLQRLGCVEVSEQTAHLGDPEWIELTHRDESALDMQTKFLDDTGRAIDLLDQYTPAKTSFLSPRPQAEAAALFDPETQRAALNATTALLEGSAKLNSVYDQMQRLRTAMKTLEPWLSLDVPLETEPSGSLYTAFGMVPAAADLEALKSDLAAKADASELYEASADAEMHYLFFLCHASQQEDALDVLKSHGFSATSFPGITGTARANYDRHGAQLAELQRQEESLLETLKSYGDARSALQISYDYLTQEVQKEALKQRLLATDRTFYLSGWVSAPEEQKLTALLSQFDCAYTLSEPTEEEYPEVPVKLKNGPLTRCMNVVTEMYSLPAYGSIDPNPVMAPFFILFFGIMMADMGYGILMIAAALVVLKKTRPREGTRNFMELVLLCGISTFILGAMTGGFFGDFIPQLLRIINPNSTFTMPALFTPLDDTVAILIGSLILGVIQVITGMVISVVKKVKDGKIADAIWDEVTWWVILAGLALMILGIGDLNGIPVVLLIGGVMLLYGGTRNAKGFGKVTALVGVIYNGVTGYFSDILSYLRLMALMLSGSVIAQVFNTLGSVFGNVILFIIIAMIGNMLNLALNLLGCYVHDLRLQCLEYFNRFYQEGGRPYAPLSIQTKYIDIIEEE